MVYSAVTRARLALYRSGALAARTIPAPVISVGNLTTGGTGKTPLVEWIARALARDGFRVCILTRGYGRRDPQARVIVSDGERLLADARRGGDEPRLLAESLLGVAAVISDADRAGAARWALEHLRSDLFILDDGFQHLRLARDLDIVTVDAMNPWGGGHLLPRGRLREPRRGLARADCIVITRADQSPDTAHLRAQIGKICGGRPVILSHAHTARLRHVTSGEVLPESAIAQPVGAFCAVGNPQAFFSHLRRDGHTINYTRTFPDHHVYTQDDLDEVTHEAAQAGAQGLLTTAKDAVKLGALRCALACYSVEIELQFDDEERLLNLVRSTAQRGGLRS
jgi:tetraacyldisaccharide 4'-kinase